MYTVPYNNNLFGIGINCKQYNWNATMEVDLERWQQVQGHIVTGGGLITANSSLYKDFLPSDLPHFLIQNNLSEETFRRWKQSNRRSHMIIGCWSRPIFAGGWQESSLYDTEAYNLQTPSLFIDMRFPLKRPTEQLYLKGSLSNCSAIDLKILARQHCFTGYSLPETLPFEQHPHDSKKFPVFTRHHIIDWNLHPNFPRNRPNRWWVELNDGEEGGSGSFKEHSIIRNKDTNLPVYFERWDRIAPYPHQRLKYFAARKIRKNRFERDATLIVVGVHFALVVDRNMADATSTVTGNPERLEHLRRHCGGGGAAYVDYLLNSELHDNIALQANMECARSYLDLEGSYGLVQDSNNNEGKTMATSSWIIRRSTHPWKEGRPLFREGESVEFSFPSLASGVLPTSLTWFPAESKDSSAPNHCVGEWEIFECSYSREELLQMFPTKNKVPIPRYLSLFSRL